MQKFWPDDARIAPSPIEVRDTGTIGRGLFLTTSARAGCCLGKFESIEINHQESITIEKMSLAAYVWEHKAKAGWLLLPFGWINFINHSRQPNCTVEWVQKSTGWQVNLYCLTDMDEDAQLFIDYGCEDAELGFAPSSSG